jgi:branched-chain amino acid transport system ATP-binding protein
LKLNKKKIFNNNEYEFKRQLHQDKLTKLSANENDNEVKTKIEELEAKLAQDIKKIDNKALIINNKITKTKKTRDHFHNLLLIKISDEIKENNDLISTLKKEIEELNTKKSEVIDNKDEIEEIDKAVASKEDTIKECTKNIEILETRDRVSKDQELLLSLSHLTMRFGGLKAVDDLSFDVKKGEIFGLIGPNGAGKTTVFNCITQFYKSNGGDIFFNDVNGETNSLLDFQTHDIINLGIVRTFQNVELIWELSVLDNLLVGSHTLYSAGFFTQLLHLPKLRYEEKVLQARAIDILKKLDILAYKDALPYGLPYGILKKIELARTLMTKPNLIILDEPAAGLNDSETADLAKLIKEIRDEFGLTIFLVEHDMGLVMDICDRICAISFGSKLAIGTPSEIQKHPKVQEAYLGGE